MSLCVLADVPSSIAHLLNVTDHSLFHLITLKPPPNTHTHNLTSVPLLLQPTLLPPFSSPMFNQHSCDPMPPQCNSPWYARVREYTHESSGDFNDTKCVHNENRLWKGCVLFARSKQCTTQWPLFIKWACARHISTYQSECERRVWSSLMPGLTLNARLKSTWTCFAAQEEKGEEKSEMQHSDCTDRQTEVQGFADRLIRYDI